MTWTTRLRSEIGDLGAIVEGQGPHVLLMHGVGLRAEAWSRQIQALAASGYYVVAPDMPGHGASPVPSGDVGLAAYTDLVAGCLTDPAVIVGHSMGAMIALDLASRYADRVRGVVALNAVFRRSAVAKAAVSARVSALDGQGTPDPSDTLARWFGETQSAERAACKEWLRAVDPVGYKAAYAVFATEDGPSTDALQELNMPALFVTGSEERNSTPEMSRNMAALVPDGRAEVIEGAAHMMPMTHADAVNRLLTAFVQRCQP